MGARAPLLAARWKRAALLLLLVWGLVSYLVISPLRCQSGEEAAAGFQQRLAAVSAQLDAVREQHAALIRQIKTSQLNGGGGSLDALLEGAGPSEEYEALRRRVYSNTKELWYYVNHELSKLSREEVTAERLQEVLRELDDRKTSLLADQQRAAAADGHAAWRRREAAAVSALVQRRLRRLQNPPHCGRARKLVCNLNKGCGFGCQVHHVAYCLIFAYATERTLVLNSRGWRYNAKGWDHVFRPLSDSCLTYEDGPSFLHWPDREYSWRQSLLRTRWKSGVLHHLEEDLFEQDPDLVAASENAKVVSLPFIDSISQKPKFLPLAVPKDLAERIVKFNGDPASWWVGQMLKYILKPLPAVERALNDTIAAMDFITPIVGMHIRRTDKVGTEAAFHHIHEYMSRVEQYWRLQDALQGRPVPRRVYLASDDPNALEQARAQYPLVQWVGDAGIARGAATHRRYSLSALHGLLVDLTLLSRADYLVCTFSSQIGRVAYELMQGNRPDASESVSSLDDIYYFGGQNAHDRRAVLPHHAVGPQDISFKVGDLIGIAGNHWNGYGRGTNRRTNLNGLIPWYKTVDQLVLYPFPLYKDVPLNENDDTDASLGKKESEQ